MIEYDKLIRDRIPEIIEGAGKKCIVEVMDDNTYLEFPLSRPCCLSAVSLGFY